MKVVNGRAIKRTKEEINKEKNLNFRNIAASRTNKAIKAISLIGNVFNRRTYEYSKEEADAITKSLEKAIKEVKAKIETGDTEAFKWT